MECSQSKDYAFQTYVSYRMHHALRFGCIPKRYVLVILQRALKMFLFVLSNGFFFLFEVLLSFDAFFRSFLLLDPSLCNQIWFRKRKHSNLNANVFAPFAATAAAVTYHTHTQKTYKENYYYFFSNFCAMFALVLLQTQKLRREKRDERKKSDEQFFPARVCFSRERPFKIICSGDDFGNSCSKLFMLTNLDSRTRFAAHFIRNGKIIIFHANKCSRCDIQKMRCNVVLSPFWKSANIFAHFVLVLFSPVARFSFSRFFSLCFFLCSRSSLLRLWNPKLLAHKMFHSLKKMKLENGSVLLSDVFFSRLVCTDKIDKHHGAERKWLAFALL